MFDVMGLFLVAGACTALFTIIGFFYGDYVTPWMIVILWLGILVYWSVFGEFLLSGTH